MLLNGFGFSKWVAVILLMHVMAGVSGSVSSFGPSDIARTTEVRANREIPLTASEPLPNWTIAWQQAQYRVPDANATGPDATASNTMKSQRVRQSYRFGPDMHHDLAKLLNVDVVATGYSAGVESTGKSPSHPEYGVTFSGLKVVRDDAAFSTIAADPKVFPLGTVMYIPGYGYGIVADTGSAIKGKKIDLYFKTKDQVYREWGKKKIKVYVVKRGTGTLNKTIWSEYINELLPQPAERTVNGNSL